MLEVPNLIESQIQSYGWFMEDGLNDVFREVSPITDYTEKKFELRLGEVDERDDDWTGPFRFYDAKYSPQECKESEISYTRPLYVRGRLVVKETGEVHQQKIFMGDFPMMTDNGTFIINGAERVVVSQLVRSPGIYFTTERPRQQPAPFVHGQAHPFPRGLAGVRDQQQRHPLGQSGPQAQGLGQHLPARSRSGFRRPVDGPCSTTRTPTSPTAICRPPCAATRPPTRAMSLSREDDLRQMWDKAPWLHEEGEEFDLAAAQRIAAAQVEFYKRLRPGEPPSLENSRNLINNLFFEKRRYDLGKVGPSQVQRTVGPAGN